MTPAKGDRTMYMKTKRLYVWAQSHALARNLFIYGVPIKVVGPIFPGIRCVGECHLGSVSMVVRRRN